MFVNSPIVDIHVHAGDFYRLRDDIQALLTKYEMDPGLEMTRAFSEPGVLEPYLRANGVTHAVIIAECGPGTNFSIDSELVANFARDSSFFTAFGSINPNFHRDPLAEWRKSVELGVKGFKLYPADHEFDPLRDDMQPVYEACMSARLPVMFHTGLTAQRDANEAFIQPAQFERLANDFPDLPIILAHGGKPHWHRDAFDMCEMHANVYVDTGLVPPENFVPFLLERPHLAQKVLFGSDWPVCGMHSQALRRYRDAELDESMLEAILGGNAMRLLALH